MKLNILIPTRGRPYQLAAALYSLFFCASGKHEIQFCVACDEDDMPTQEALRALRPKMPLFVRLGPRPETLGSVANDLAAHWPADAYAIWADDLMCVTYGWDEVVAQAVEEKPYGVFWWTPARDEATYVPVVTEKWRAATGFVFTDHFPFWYDDIWLHELWIFATGEDPIALNARVVDKPRETQRMRDLHFWHEFYHGMRPLRVRQAREIAAKLGLGESALTPYIVPRLDAASKVPAGFLEDIEEKNKAETTPPSDAYLRTKARAEKILKEAA